MGLAKISCLRFWPATPGRILSKRCIKGNYLSKAPKDRAAYEGLRAAQEDVRLHGNLPIPMVIRNAPTKLMKELGYGKGYDKYTKEDLLPEKLRGKKYYQDKT